MTCEPIIIISGLCVAISTVTTVSRVLLPCYFDSTTPCFFFVRDRDLGGGVGWGVGIQGRSP